MSEEGLVGIGRGQRVLERGSRYPYVKLGDGDRARFHALTSGGDGHFASAIFHKFGQGMETRTLVCTASLSEKFAQECKFCEAGHTDVQGRFGLWIYLHQVLHLGDNPDPKGDPWKSAKVTEANRTMFVEDIKKPVLLRLAAGRGQAWFKQFSGFWMARESNLQLDLYELLRVGTGLATEYTLTIVKEMAIKPAVAKHQADLPGCEEIFLEELKFSPVARSAGMGEDTLEGGGVDPVAGDDAEPALPTVEQVTQPAAEEPRPEDDGLI